MRSYRISTRLNCTDGCLVTFCVFCECDLEKQNTAFTKVMHTYNCIKLFFFFIKLETTKLSQLLHILFSFTKLSHPLVSNKLPPYGSSSLPSRHSSHLQRIKGVWMWWVVGYCVCYDCLCAWRVVSESGGCSATYIVSPYIETLTWLTLAG